MKKAIGTILFVVGFFGLFGVADTIIAQILCTGGATLLILAGQRILKKEKAI